MYGIIVTYVLSDLEVKLMKKPKLTDEQKHSRVVLWAVLHDAFGFCHYRISIKYLA